MSTTTQPELKERIAMATEGITKGNANKVLVKSLEMYRKQREAGDLTLALILAALMAKYQCEFHFHTKSLNLHERIQTGTRESGVFRNRSGGALHLPTFSPDRITIAVPLPGNGQVKLRGKCPRVMTIWRSIAATEREMNALITIRDERKKR